MSTQQEKKVVHPRVRGGGGRWWLVYALSASICVLALGGTYLLFVEAPPPRNLVIATGGSDGAYYKYGREYAELLKKDGITLDVRATKGSVENVRLLTDDQSGVSVAIIQSGVADAEQKKHLVALGSLYREPLWIFYRDENPQGEKPLELEFVSQLAGKRLAIGPPGSGTRVAALEILKANGIEPADAGGKSATTFLESTGEPAAKALSKGDVDAAFFVASVEAPYVRSLVAAEGVRLLSVKQHEAYQRIYRHFLSVTIPAGLVDLGKKIPTHDTYLIGPTAMLVVRKDFSPELVWSLLVAASKVHNKPTLLSQPNEFPSAAGIDVPLNQEAESYYKSGLPVLHRFLPFWIASLVDRLKIMLIPLVMLLMPVIRMTPPLVRWRTQRKIYRWYARLRAIDQKLIAGASVAELRRELEQLCEIEDQVAAVDVPLSYMGEFYNMRFHLSMMRAKLEKLLAEKGVAARGAGAPPPAGEIFFAG